MKVKAAGAVAGARAAHSAARQTTQQKPPAPKVPAASLLPFTPQLPPKGHIAHAPVQRARWLGDRQPTCRHFDKHGHGEGSGMTVPVWSCHVQVYSCSSRSHLQCGLVCCNAIQAADGPCMQLLAPLQLGNPARSPHFVSHFIYCNVLWTFARQGDQVTQQLYRLRTLLAETASGAPLLNHEACLAGKCPRHIAIELVYIMRIMHLV